MKRLLSGNEALALGAWEAGVAYASAYPGTPSTEILENLAGYQGVKAEWASNEKVAVDAAFGACLSGGRALAAMKHVGVNVAADSLFSISYTGVRGGLVIITADDPGCWSSQNEQDNRRYAKFAKIPCLEPADSQEAHDFIGAAFAMSEEFDTPVLLRSTTRLSHSKTPVDVNPPRQRAVLGSAPFVPDPAKLVMIPARARLRHSLVEQRVQHLAELAEISPLNRIEWRSERVGIITSGIAYQYAREIFADASILKLGMSYPLPDRLMHAFATGVERLLVIEELDPFFEEHVRALGLAVEGKRYFPMAGELSLDVVRRGAVALGLARPLAPAATVQPVNLPPRIPALCPGCSHRSVFYALRKLKLQVMGDIGCYSIGTLPPFGAMDVLTCMGASIGMMAGAHAAGVEKPFVAVIGDSTFFHTGLPALASMVYNRTPGAVLILDNGVTGMTGQQGNPGSGLALQGQGQALDIAAVVRALGVGDVETVDAFNERDVEAAIKRAVALTDRPAVVVVRGVCVFLPQAVRKPAVTVETEQCNGCSLCFRVGCPAILKGELDEATQRPRAVIDPLLCVGCDVCLQICPRHAIVRPQPQDVAMAGAVPG